MKISVVLGTRPEVIKLAPVILALRLLPGFDCHVCATGQHREMIDPELSVFDIKPDVALNLMKPNQALSSLASRVLETLDRYFDRENPNAVLVQGDTTSAFCASLAAFHRKIPVGHVEAGLRTWNMQAPWPEEANRVLISRLASFHFAPTENARQNLLKEGISGSSITVTGNTVIDSLFLALKKVQEAPPHIPELPDYLQPSAEALCRDPKLILITGHRRENFGKGFEKICSSIAELSRLFPDVHCVYPVHMNPNVQEPVVRILKGSAAGGLPNVHLIEPLPYLHFVGLMNRATLILTDSGGVQEEAPSIGKPVLVMRDTTERPEAVAAGTARLVGTDPKVILNEVTRLLTDESAYAEMSHAQNPYGDGKAAERIVRVLCTMTLSA